jgi:predicted nucleic acid-binding protein
LTELADTTVLILRQRSAPVADWFATRLNADAIAICDMVALEYLMGARTGQHYDELQEALSAVRWVTIELTDWNRAREVQRALAHQTGGGQRSVKIPDLLIAAAAERVEMNLVHYDEDYDRIASITGQPTSWVMPRGSA